MARTRMRCSTSDDQEDPLSTGMQLQIAACSLPPKYTIAVAIKVCENTGWYEPSWVLGGGFRGVSALNSVQGPASNQTTGAFYDSFVTVAGTRAS